MSSSPKTVIAFDLYGTLLATESIAKELGNHFGYAKAQSIAAKWRRYQLEYTWRMNSMSLYKPFSEITHASLQHALAEQRVSLSEDDERQLMKAYDSLSMFPDVKPALESLADDSTIDAYVFSNGSDAMVTSSVTQSKSLSPHAGVFKGLVTVEEAQVFKPDRRVYEYLAKRVGQDMGRIWLVSGNPFDIVGARLAGMEAAWVDRAGGHHGMGGWNDKLGDVCGVQPSVIVTKVDDAVEAIRRWDREHAPADSTSK
ncbi:haloacid dehalogenase [Phlyctema vagabunda]|uniref:Haloacid dehalogenase n=1 Tax=Phlyctema vagabunda TaxID=108571 RepID=A0ABR4PSZ6_9HELO